MESMGRGDTTENRKNGDTVETRKESERVNKPSYSLGARHPELEVEGKVTAGVDYEEKQRVSGTDYNGTVR